MSNRKTCITDVWDEIIKFNDTYFPEWRKTKEIYYSNALAGEVGEVCNLIKHRAGGGTNKSNPSDYELMEELADVFIYLELLVEQRGLDVTSLADAIHSKVQINIKRMENKNKQQNWKFAVANGNLSKSEGDAHIG